MDLIIHILIVFGVYYNLYNDKAPASYTTITLTAASGFTSDYNKAIYWQGLVIIVGTYKTTGSYAANNYTTIASINPSYAPSNYVYFKATCNGMIQSCSGRINSSGQIQIYNSGNSNYISALPSPLGVHCMIVYAK